MAQVILRLPEVRARVKLSRSAIYQKIRELSFPAPFPIGGYGARARGWLESEIDQFVQDCANQRQRPKKAAP
jgi:prophage regulatory protein